jgi:3-oxoacyl-[acyl-carrier protein] reductase
MTMYQVPPGPLLAGKVTIVTGSSRGIGRAIALAYARHGATVVLNHSQDGADIEETVGELRAMDAVYDVQKGSIADPEFADRMISTTVERFGRLDVLVNNAGITRDRLMMMQSVEDWRAVIDINLTGTFLCSQAALRPMIRQKEGRIINISSVTSIAGRAGQAAYGAAKAGINGMTRSLAREVGAYNVMVNAVVVGVVDTQMSRQIPRAQLEDIRKRIPLQRLGQPEEVANTCLFLGSGLATFMTGSCINVTGGGYM